MTSEWGSFARTLVHSDLARLDQLIGLIWSVYPNEVALSTALQQLEGAGMPSQNQSRTKRELDRCRSVSHGKARGTFRINPRYKEGLDQLYGVLCGAPQSIVVQDAEVLIPNGTLPLDRRYIKMIVDQINQGYVVGHYDASAVMLRRLTESLLIESYVRTGRQAEIQRDGSFLMLDKLISVIEADPKIVRSRNLARQLRKVKEIGDNAAHSRNYITKKADLDDIKFDARRCVSELAHLSGVAL